jgi:1-phosphatidylinositol-3-phosphate 5-kinase
LLHVLQASFLEFAPAYFEHMAHAEATGKPTTLAKIAGVYSISFKQQSAASTAQGAGGAAGLFKDGCIDVLVMENIFYDRQISRIYDLKGSERSRWGSCLTPGTSVSSRHMGTVTVSARSSRAIHKAVRGSGW